MSFVAAQGAAVAPTDTSGLEVAQDGCPSARMPHMYDLLYSSGSCSRAAHFALQKCAVPHRLHPVSALKGETTRPEYLAINPKGRAPLFAFDAHALNEVPAILTGLAGAHAGASLLPEPPLAWARTGNV
jgi:glutathione S-transferase